LTADHCGIILEVTPRHAKEEATADNHRRQFECKYNEETEETTLYVANKVAGTQVCFVKTDLIDFVEELQDEVARYTEDPVVVELNIMAKIFRIVKIVVACGGLGGDKLGRRGRQAASSGASLMT
jgi:hypothetical protein